MIKNTFTDGWATFWYCVCGLYGRRCWLGFATATTVSSLCYEVLKTTVLYVFAQW